ncbi:MAG: ATP-binding protein [Acidiferrobacterales bacterium]
MNSIRRRLLVWMLSALALVGVAASVVTYFQAREDVNDLFDYQLQQLALSLEHRPGALPRVDRGDAEDRREESDFVTQIWDRDGKLVFASHGQLTLPRAAGRGYAMHVWNNRQWRDYQTTWRGLTIQVAQPMSARDEMAAAMALRILVPVLVLIPFLGIIIWISVGRGLVPLDEIGAALAARSPSAMSPLSAIHLPVELAPMVSAINGLLERLSLAMETQRQFIADAAHELRTPLTAVQLQLQLVERAESREERDAALADLKCGIERAIHLVRQLLALARAQPDAAVRTFSAVSIDGLARTVVAEYAVLAVDKGVDLGIGRLEPVVAMGDAESLRTMMGNLVDNAIRYTPGGGRVDLSVYPQRREAVLEVEDSGPGIPQEERSRVFDRFYRRPGSQVQGSGLGLAIVKNVVDRHRGRIILGAGRNGQGLMVTVTVALAGRE